MDDLRAVVQELIDAEPAPAEPGTVGWLSRLCGAATRSLSSAGVGLTLMAGDGVRGVVAASDGVSRSLEELQFTVGEGPCMDAYGTRAAVLEPDLVEATERWPAYSAAAYEKGVRAVFAFPMQIGTARLGVLDVYRQEPGPLSQEAIGRVEAFADAAVANLLDDQQAAAAGGAEAAATLALQARLELYQAQGMVTVQLEIGLDEAMARLRAYAYAEDLSLSQVAADIVGRRLHLGRDLPVSDV
ncbi:MAG: GAF and ANTAR domain-containing protein [Nocardioidaceae bacterium]